MTKKKRVRGRFQYDPKVKRFRVMVPAATPPTDETERERRQTYRRIYTHMNGDPLPATPEQWEQMFQEDNPA